VRATGRVLPPPEKIAHVSAANADLLRFLADPDRLKGSTFMKRAQVSLCSAFLAMYFSCQAHAQWTGTYEYKEKDFSGKMIVTDVSLCELEKSLGCLAAVRPLVINLSTKGKIGGGTCAIKSTENPSARIGYQNRISASFRLEEAQGKPASWIDIEFRKGSAVVELSRTEVPVAVCEGTGRFVGTWRKIAN
jgi:hypothetical protein